MLRVVRCLVLRVAVGVVVCLLLLCVAWLVLCVVFGSLLFVVVVCCCKLVSVGVLVGLLSCCLCDRCRLL